MLGYFIKLPYLSCPVTLLIAAAYDRQFEAFRFWRGAL